jgi:hypothetical protein
VTIDATLNGHVFLNRYRYYQALQKTAAPFQKVTFSTVAPAQHSPNSKAAVPGVLINGVSVCREAKLENSPQFQHCWHSAGLHALKTYQN